MTQQLPFARDLRQELLIDDVQDHPGSGTGHRIATKGTAVVPRLEELGGLACGDACPHGEATTESLGHGDHVGANIVVLESEELTGATNPGLYLVADHEDAMLVAQLAYLGEEPIGCGHHAGFTLDGLQEDGGHVVVKRWEALNVAVGVIFDAAGMGSNFFRLSGWPVRASAPMVRPWNPCSAARIRLRPVARAF